MGVAFRCRMNIDVNEPRPVSRMPKRKPGLFLGLAKSGITCSLAAVDVPTWLHPSPEPFVNMQDRPSTADHYSRSRDVDRIGVLVERSMQGFEGIEDALSGRGLALVVRQVGDDIGAKETDWALVRALTCHPESLSQRRDQRSVRPMAHDGPVRQSIRLGAYRGIPVGINWSVIVIFGLVTWELSTYVFPSAYVGARPAYWVAAIVAAVLFLGSLLAHELTHAIVARRHGVAVHSITLWLFGGVAQLGGEALTPGADFRIAAAGPGTSVLLVGVFAGVEALTRGAGWHGPVTAVATWLWQINLLLAAFNLIPAAPLDGGRILRAGLWQRSGDQSRATVLAARVGRGFGLALVAVCAALFVAYDDAYWLWPAVVGGFLSGAARAEERAALVRSCLAGLRVGDVMNAKPPAIASSTSVAELVHYHLPWYTTDAIAVVGTTGWLEGILPLDRVKALPPLSHADTLIGDLEIPIAEVPVARPEEPAQHVLQRMAAAHRAPAVVLDADNRLAGIVTETSVDRTVHMNGSGVGSR